MNLCSFCNDVNSIDEGTNKHISNQIKKFIYSIANKVNSNGYLKSQTQE